MTHLRLVDHTQPQRRDPRLIVDADDEPRALSIRVAVGLLLACSLALWCAIWLVFGAAVGALW